jgi:hypothetical protein
MNKLYAFWVSRPPDPAMSYDLWLGFRNEVLGWLIGWVVVSAAIIIILYMWQSRKLTVRTPLDPFVRFVPMRWLWFAVVPGIVVGIIYVLRYEDVFPQAQISPIGGAVGAALLSTFLAYAIGQIAMWIPGVTPRKFLYHPRWPWRLLARRRT